MHRRRFLATGVLTAGVTLTHSSSLHAARTPQLSVGLIADAQYADIEPWKTRYYRESIGKLAAAVEHFNQRELAFCVSLGDFIDRDWKSYDAIAAPLAKSRHTFYHVLGNHDFDVDDECKHRVPEKLGLTQRYYRIERGGWCFVMLDTTDVSLFAQRANTAEHAAASAEFQRIKSSGAAHAQSWNGAISDQQLQWLDATCRAAARAGRRVIVCAHHPIFPANVHNAWNDSRILDVITRHRVVAAWLNGHNHAGNFGNHADIPFVTLQGMVETADTNAFAVLHLYPDRLEITGSGREPSRELRLRPVGE